MRNLLVYLAALGLLSGNEIFSSGASKSMAVAANGTITGTIKVAKSPGASKPIQMASDPKCVEVNKGKTVSKTDVIVNDKNQVADTFVYLSAGVDASKAPKAPSTPVVFDQKGCVYHPVVFGIRAGQPLKILNSDPTLHNVHSLAKVNKSDNFNNGMVQGQELTKSFKKPETMVKVKCDVHSWMVAYVGVMDHPYFAVTDQNGQFTIKDVPPGKYTLTAWHQKFDAKTAEVTVADGGSQTVDLSY